MADGMLTEDPNVMGQDLAEATGVSSTAISSPDSEPSIAQPLAPTAGGFDTAGVSRDIAENVDFGTGLESVDADKSTVRGQLQSLFAEGSPYITQAEARGREEAAARGLLSSSISAGAARRAAIDAALPIAQQDADIYAGAQGRAQEARLGVGRDIAAGTVKGALAQQEQDFEAGQAELGREHELYIQGQNIASQERMQQMSQDAQKDLQTQAEAFQNTQNELQRQWQGTQAGLDREQQVAMQTMQQNHDTNLLELRNQQEKLMAEFQADERMAENILISSNNILQDYQASVLALLTSPSFLELSGADMNNAIGNLRTMAENQISFIGSMNQINLDAYLDAAFPAVTF